MGVTIMLIEMFLIGLFVFASSLYFLVTYCLLGDCTSDPLVGSMANSMGARAEQSVDTLACACVARDDRGSRQPDHVRRRFACHRGAVAAKRHGQLQGLDREAGVLISAHPTLHQSNAKDKLLAAATIGGVVAVGLPFLVERPRKASALHLFCEGGHR